MTDWVSCAELARRCNVSRNAVKKAVQELRINPSDVRRVGSRSVQVGLAAGLQVLGHHAGATAAAAVSTAPAAGMFAWGISLQAPPPAEPTSPSPVPDTAPELATVLARERDWIASYDAFRRWITDGISLDLMRGLPDPAPIGDVMVLARDLLLERLEQLDTMERCSRFSPEQMRRGEEPEGRQSAHLGRIGTPCRG